MKVSNYNFFWDTENDNKIAYNSMTNALAEVDDKFFEILDNVAFLQYGSLSDEEQKIYAEMRRGFFIVEDCVDELKILKARHRIGRYGVNGLGLTIAPTMNCNFKCPYCYETPKPGVMKKEIQDAIIKTVKEYAENKCASVGLTWYGGEPLLAKDVVYNLSGKIIDICDEHEMQFQNYIVTNGYLLDDDDIRKFKEINMSGAQITLDGPPHIHNQRRVLKLGKKGTFDVIVNNIIKLAENKIRPEIRINVDKNNEDYIEELVDILIAKGLKDIGIHLGHVSAETEACSSIAGTCLKTEEYAMNNYKFQRMLNQKKMNSHFYPKVKTNYCSADAQNGYVIDAEGYMYKCWCEVGQTDLASGHIVEDDSIRSVQRNMARKAVWMTWDPFEFDNCLECKLLPLCMGGCPDVGLREGEPNCEFWKYTLEQALKMTYTKELSRKGKQKTVQKAEMA